MTLDDVNALMRAQAATLHHRQARALGLSQYDIDARLRSGAWIEPHPRVYVAAGAPHTFVTRCHAAVLAIRHGGRWTERRPVAVARLSAAVIHGLDVPEPARVDVIVPFADAARTLAGVHVVRAPTWERRAFGVVGGLPVTSLPDTLVDIGRLVERGRLHTLVQDAAFGRNGLPLAVLRACRRGRHGSANARRAAALVLGGVDSSLHEEGVALLRAAGLHEVECGVEVVRGAGPSDCVVRTGAPAPPYGLVVEWDGDAHRVDRATFLHDREKDRLLRRAGWVTLRYTSAQVRRPDVVVADLRAEWAALLARFLQPTEHLPA